MKKQRAEKTVAFEAFLLFGKRIMPA